MFDRVLKYASVVASQTYIGTALESCEQKKWITQHDFLTGWQGNKEKYWSKKIYFQLH